MRRVDHVQRLITVLRVQASHLVVRAECTCQLRENRVAFHAYVATTVQLTFPISRHTHVLLATIVQTEQDTQLSFRARKVTSGTKQMGKVCLTVFHVPLASTAKVQGCMSQVGHAIQAISALGWHILKPHVTMIISHLATVCVLQVQQVIDKELINSHHNHQSS